MIKQLTKEDKGTLAAGIGILLLSVAAFAYTGNFLAFAIPAGALLMYAMFLNWRWVYWFLLFSIPVSVHLTFFDGSLSTSLPDEPMMWMFLLLFPILLARQPDILEKWWWRNPLVFIIVLQYLWLIVTVFYSKEPLFSVKFLAAKTWFIVTYFVFPIWIFKEKKDFKKAFLLFLIPLIGTILAVMVRHAMLGFQFRKIEKAIGLIYYNHVDYSTVLSMFFPILLVAYSLSKGLHWWIRFGLVLMILFFLPALYLTYARAAMLAVVFAIVINIAIRLKLVNLIMPVFYGLMTMLVFYMVKDNTFMNFRPNYRQTYMHSDFASHMAATLRGQDMSSMERVYRWIAAARMSTDEPVTGYGPNAFYHHYKPYAVSSFRTYVSRNPEGSTTHNYFLYMLTEQGWPAMILYAILVFVVFMQAQKIYYRFNDRFYKKCTLGVAMMFGAGFINNFFSELIENHKVGALFYLSIALLVILDKKSRELQNKPVEEPKP